MPSAEVHEQGIEVYDSAVARLPGLLEELLAAPAARVSEHPLIPEAPGIYLFSEPGNGEAVTVEISAAMALDTLIYNSFETH